MSRPVPGCFDRARDRVTPVLATATASLEPELRRVVEYHFGWLDADGRAIEARPGKALRPTLALLSARAVGRPEACAVSGAAAVELVHDFTLLHDDVMDEDRERRGRPAAWTCFGIGRAICAGDALVALAQRLLLADPSAHRLSAVDALCEATGDVIAGQALDLAFEGRVDIGVADYLDMASKKTGALLSCASALGAILGGADSEAVKALRAFGLSLGLAFQAVDDWLGIWGEPDRVGKPAASDLRQRKASLPIVLTMASSGAAGASMRAWMRGRGPVDEADIPRAIDWLDAAGAELETRTRARRALASALASLEGRAIDADARDELAEVATFVVEREF